MKKIQRIILICLLILFILLVFTNNSKATVTFNNVPSWVLELKDTYDYANNPNYNCIMYLWDNNYTILFIEKDSDLKWYRFPKSEGSYWLLANKTFNGFGVTYNANNHTFQSSATFVNMNWMSTHKGAFVNNDCINSTFDIYTDNTFSTIFFFRPVEGMKDLPEESMKTFQTMIVGMIPYLMVFLVSLVAFWKSWQFLSRVLRQG